MGHLLDGVLDHGVRLQLLLPRLQAPLHPMTRRFIFHHMKDQVRDIIGDTGTSVSFPGFGAIATSGRRTHEVAHSAAMFEAELTRDVFGVGFRRRSAKLDDPVARQLVPRRGRHMEMVRRFRVQLCWRRFLRKRRRFLIRRRRF